MSSNKDTRLQLVAKFNKYYNIEFLQYMTKKQTLQSNDSIINLKYIPLGVHTNVRADFKQVSVLN